MGYQGQHFQALLLSFKLIRLREVSIKKKKISELVLLQVSPRIIGSYNVQVFVTKFVVTQYRSFSCFSVSPSLGVHFPYIATWSAS